MKSPAEKAGLRRERYFGNRGPDYAALNFRRTSPAIPTKPVPSRPRVPGSGVTKVSPLTAPCPICNVTDTLLPTALTNDSVQHHNASTCKRPLEQCRTTGIRDVDHATREGEPAGDSSQGTRGKAYCSARWL